MPIKIVINSRSQLKTRKLKNHSAVGYFNAQKISARQAQDKQDEIFKKMSADRKIKLGSQLWLLGKELGGDKINYGTNRSKTTFSEGRADS